MKNRLLLLFIVFILFSAFRADKPVLTIFTIGDSTMANKKSVRWKSRTRLVYGAPRIFFRRYTC